MSRAVPGAAGRRPASRRGRRRSTWLLALLLALPSLGDITTSSLTGRVVVDGAPAAGVTVTAASSSLQHPRATVTNANGRYWLGALPPGVYDVTFSLAGHTTLTKRAVLELARVARADATLEANPDEDTVTSTATTVTVAETIFPTTHFDDRALDRMPTGRIGTAALAPGYLLQHTLVDGIPTGPVTSEETVEQLTVVNGASPVEWHTFAGTAAALRTRSGGEDFFFTLRDTITSSEWNDVDGIHFPAQDDGAMHFAEAGFGGRVVPERLWFFAAAWRGEQAFPYELRHDGSMLKVDAQLGAAHHLDVSYNDTRESIGFLPFESDTASLRYTAALGTRLTSEVTAGRTTIGSGGAYEATSDFLSGRASYAVGDHVLTAGIAAHGGEGPDYHSLHASDRFTFSRFHVYAGLRYDDGEFADGVSPRIGVSYDLHGNGARAVIATWGEYAPPAHPQDTLRIATLGFASAIGNSGSARADFLRREANGFWQHDLQLDARYRLFDRFEAGATYTLTKNDESGGVQPIYPEQNANVWLGAEVPVGSHEFGVTVLQRYVDYVNRTVAPTDVALRYAIPFSRVGLLIAADATNVFLHGERAFAPRGVRLWVRLGVR